MTSILEEYMKQISMDKLNEDNSLPTNNTDELERQYSSVNDMDNYVSRLSAMRDDPNDMANKFHKEYPHISEKKFEEDGRIITEEVSARVIHVYCPQCGRELVCKHKPLFNPYTKEKIAKHECPCGFKANLDYAYPRIEYTDGECNKVVIENII